MNNVNRCVRGETENKTQTATVEAADIYLRDELDWGGIHVSDATGRLAQITHEAINEAIND